MRRGVNRDTNLSEKIQYVSRCVEPYHDLRSRSSINNLQGGHDRTAEKLGIDKSEERG